MDRNKLRHILHSRELPKHITVLMSYSNTQICMQLPTGQMIKETFNMGVRQGCGTSPLFFNLYLHSVAHHQNQQLEVTNITNNLKTRFLFYLSCLQMARLFSQIMNGPGGSLVRLKLGLDNKITPWQF